MSTNPLYSDSIATYLSANKDKLCHTQDIIVFISITNLKSVHA